MKQVKLKLTFEEVEALIYTLDDITEVYEDCSDEYTNEVAKHLRAIKSKIKEVY